MTVSITKVADLNQVGDTCKVTLLHAYTSLIGARSRVKSLPVASYSSHSLPINRTTQHIMTPKDMIVLIDLYDEYIQDIQTSYTYKTLDEIEEEHTSFSGFIKYLKGKTPKE